MTERERLCVIEWLNNGFNGTKAYMTVYKNCKTKGAARTNFSKMMKKPEVQEFKDKLIKDLESTEIASVPEILMYLTDVMRGNVKDAFGLDASIDERTKAAEKLMKAKGMFTQKVDITSNGQTVIVDDIDE